MSAMPEPTFETVVSELHGLVKKKSSVPKVAKAIDMNYYSLRDNLNGTSDIRLSTVYKVLEAIDVSWVELMRHARAAEGLTDPTTLPR